MKLSLCMPYFRNPRMLHRHLLVWRNEWSADLKSQVEIVLVDDGSPDETAAEALAAMWNGDRAGLPPLRLYRVLINRQWGQHAARNVAAKEAHAKHLLMTDMDHVVCASTLAEVLRLLPLGKREAITFGRVDAPRSLTWRAADWPEFARTRREDGSIKVHPNSFVVRRSRFFEIGAYEEAFVGVYGTDRHFINRLHGPGSMTHHLDHAPLIRVDRSVIPDASTRDVERKTEANSKLKKAVLARKTLEGRANTTTVLQSPYERIL